jgi:hypothetical protein
LHLDELACGTKLKLARTMVYILFGLQGPSSVGSWWGTLKHDCGQVDRKPEGGKFKEEEVGIIIKPNPNL